MGKAKKQKSKKNTLVLPGSEAVQEVNSPALLDGLSSLTGATREATCVALASIFGDQSVHNTAQKQRVLNCLIKEGVIKRLIPRVVDPSSSVRLHALGALRNMSVTGGLDLCEYITGIDAIKTVLKVFQDPNMNAPSLEQAISLLANLCESSSAAVNQITHPDMIPILQKGLDSSTGASPVLQLEVSKFLLIVTDNNPPFWDLLLNASDLIQGIRNIIEKRLSSSLVCLNLAGALLNIPSISANPEFILPLLEDCLQFDASAVMSQAQSLNAMKENLSNIDASNIEIEDDCPEKQQIEKEKENQVQAASAFRAWKDSVQTVALALELVHDLVAMPDSDDNLEEWDSDDDEAMERMAPEMSGAAENTRASVLSAEKTHTVLCLVHRILSSTIATPAALSPLIAKDLHLLRVRSCSCLSNLVQSCPSSVDKDGQNLFTMLLNAYQSWKSESTAFESSKEDSIDDFEAAVTSTIWTVLRSTTVVNVSDSDLDTLEGLYKTSTSVLARSNLVGMVGTIGTSHTASNLTIGTLLFAWLRDPSIAVVSECLNGLFEIYGDEKHDAIFHQLGYIQLLTSVAAEMKEKIRAERKSLGPDVVAYVKETRLNLVRFIKYKQKTL